MIGLFSNFNKLKQSVMTKKIENSPTAKSRIREYISDHQLAVKAVETQCGYSNGFLSAGGEIGSDRLAKFIENFPDADLYYIVLGKKRESSHPEMSEVEKKRLTLSMELASVLKRIIDLNSL